MGSNTSKANVNQVLILNQISDVLRQEKLNVLSYAADGDNAYFGFVNDTINKWNFNSKPVLSLQEPSFISDPLHVMKRGRYRLISKQMRLLEKDSPNLHMSEKQYLIELLNLPSIVFSDSKITKMHDILPLKLFNVNNFVLLESIDEKELCAYSLPFMLLNTHYLSCF